MEEKDPKEIMQEMLAKASEAVKFGQFMSERSPFERMLLAIITQYAFMNASDAGCVPKGFDITEGNNMFAAFSAVGKACYELHHEMVEEKHSVSTAEIIARIGAHVAVIANNEKSFTGFDEGDDDD